MTEDQIDSDIQYQRKHSPVFPGGIDRVIREVSRVDLGRGHFEVIEIVERIRIRIVKGPEPRGPNAN